MADLTSALRTSEDEVQRLRHLLAEVATWINNPDYDDTARAALALAIGLPAPASQR
ncbi:hypothetical protein ACF06X_33580 [Streptomyces sp. NPDC015346]|uniref:hypothetical protein n=1 Tax=Streptomyces sp. NPDC015346 TaxID=3364954 RepID=UPI0036F6A706